MQAMVKAVDSHTAVTYRDTSLIRKRAPLQGYLAHKK